MSAFTPTQPRPRWLRLAQFEAYRAALVLIQAGYIVPCSPAPGVYAWKRAS